MVGTAIHLVVSFATLLSGSLRDCRFPTDVSCLGGVAAVSAMLRNYSQGEPSIVVPFADRQSPFVQMHPLGWSVNRLILQEIMGWKVFGAPPSLLHQNRIDYNVSQQDLSDMQSIEVPLLLTNVNVPPSNSWFRYTQPIFFDEATGLAIMCVYNSNEPLSHSQVLSTRGSLNSVARINAENGCGIGEASLYNRYSNISKSKTGQCWVPVILYADIRTHFLQFLEGVLQHENPPALIIDLEGNSDSYSVPRRIGGKGTWLVSYYARERDYLHHRITLSWGNRSISAVELLIDDLLVLDSTLRDEQYNHHIMALRQQADEAYSNDPVVGRSTAMPITRDGSFRSCKAGECAIGNLFTDAALWWADADVAFVTSGGFRGRGWESGNVRVSNIWEALPFPNQMCVGVMNGISLFKLFNYSINEATFEGENTENGDRLLQVAGIRITFNLQMKGQRLIAMEVWDKEQAAFIPVERLKLYKFVTDSFVCGAFDPYPALLGTNLTAPGEARGTILDGDIHQNVVVDYIRQLGGVYQAGVVHRIANDTSALSPLNLIQTADDCAPGMFWQEQYSTCEVCPERYQVSFIKENVAFEAETGSETFTSGYIELVNTELFDVAITPKSRPSWLHYSTAELDKSNLEINISDGVPVRLQSGERMLLTIHVVPGFVEPGTAQGTVAFGVLNGGEFMFCPGQDASFEVIMRVLPGKELNHLGKMRITGWVTSGVATATSIFFIIWIHWNKNLRIVKTMQPFFLLMISVGVLIMSLSMVTMSIDDEIASQWLCDGACMATPWLLSMGNSIAMASLFSKLWRINKLFRFSGMRRMKIKEKDVMLPFGVMVSLNVSLLLTWTIIEPLRFFRLEVSEDESWNTFGACQSSPNGNGPIALAMMILVIFVNLFALACACYQAYIARDISDEFSESTAMGIALFSWLQLSIVGFPVLYLINNDNPKAKYFLQVLLVFALSMSMLLFIFIPILMQAYKSRTDDDMDYRRSSYSFSLKNVGTTRISGLYQQNPNRDEFLRCSNHRVYSETDANVANLPVSMIAEAATLGDSDFSIQVVTLVADSTAEIPSGVIECNGPDEETGEHHNSTMSEPAVEVTENDTENDYSDRRDSSLSIEHEINFADSAGYLRSKIGGERLAKQRLML